MAEKQHRTRVEIVVDDDQAQRALDSLIRKLERASELAAGIGFGGGGGTGGGAGTGGGMGASVGGAGGGPAAGHATGSTSTGQRVGQALGTIGRGALAIGRGLGGQVISTASGLMGAAPSLGQDVGAATEIRGQLNALMPSIRGQLLDTLSEVIGGANVGIGGSAGGFGGSISLPVGLPLAIPMAMEAMNQKLLAEGYKQQAKMHATGQRQMYSAYQQVGAFETPFAVAQMLMPGVARARATGLSQAEYMQGMGGFARGYAMMGSQTLRPFGRRGDDRYEALINAGKTPADELAKFQDLQRASQTMVAVQTRRLRPEYLTLAGLDPGLAGSLMGGFGAGMGMTPMRGIDPQMGAAVLPGEAGMFTNNILGYAQRRGFRGSRANEWWARAQAGFTQLGEQGLGANPTQMMNTIAALGQVGQTGDVPEANLAFGGMNAIRGAFKLRQGGIQAAQGFAGQMGAGSWADMAVQAWAFSKTNDPLKAMELMENMSGAQFSNVVRSQLGSQAGGMALFGKGFTARQARGLASRRLETPGFDAGYGSTELGMGFAPGTTGADLKAQRPITSIASEQEALRLEFAAREKNLEKMNKMVEEMNMVTLTMMHLGAAAMEAEGPLRMFGDLMNVISIAIEKQGAEKFEALIEQANRLTSP